MPHTAPPGAAEAFALIARFVEDVVYTRQKMSAVALYSDECDTVVVSVGYSPEDYADAADEMLSQLGPAPSARSA